MKKNAKWLLNVVRMLLQAAWYLNLVLIVFVLVVLTVSFIASDYFGIDVPVRYRVEQAPVTLQSLSDNARNISLHANDDMLKMEVKATPFRIISTYVLFMCVELLLMTILYQLRKIFATFRQNIPFKYENVRRLKIIALCVILYLPLGCLEALGDYCTLAENVSGYKNTFFLSWDINFYYLLIGAVIYIMADIFRYGFELQQENKEFV